MTYRRINLFAGPGAGKSTTASLLFSQLKRRGYNAELVTEYVKTWAYQEIIPTSYDQLHIFSEQLRREVIPLQHGCDLIVTDSPLHLSYYYGRRYDLKYDDYILDMIKEFDEEFPPINIMIERNPDEFNQNGRFQDLKQSIIIDAELEKMISGEFGLYYDIFEKGDEKLIYYIVDKLETMNAN